MEFDHHHPLVSILFPVRNQRRFVQSALASIQSQSYTALEILIADGGSTDGTIEVLENSCRRDSRVRIISRSDSGPANALNIALASSRGTIIGWLNSDDLYADDAVSSCVDFFKSKPDAIMLYGHAEFIDENGQVTGVYPVDMSARSVQDFSQGCFICQPATFFLRTLPVAIGDFRENLSTAFDFEFWVRAFQSFPTRIYFLDRLRAFSRMHSDSITSRLREQVILEGMCVIRGALGFAPLSWFITFVNEVFNSSTGANQRDMTKTIQAFTAQAAVYLTSGQLAAGLQYVNARLDLLKSTSKG